VTLRGRLQHMLEIWRSELSHPTPCAPPKSLAGYDEALKPNEFIARPNHTHSLEALTLLHPLVQLPATHTMSVNNLNAEDTDNSEQVRRLRTRSCHARC
jgi:hypothetical protein